MKLKNLKVRSLIGRRIVDVLLDNGYIFKETSEDTGVVTLNYDAKENMSNKAHIIQDGNILIIRKELYVLEIEKLSREFLFDLLDMNTEILPISLAIDSRQKKSPKLVLNESLHMENLDVSEVLMVFDTIESNIDKILELTSKYPEGLVAID
jgi:hypothetical protein